MLWEGKRWKVLLCPFFLSLDAGRVSFAARAFSCSPGKGFAGGNEWQHWAGAGEQPLQSMSRLVSWHHAKEGALLGMRSSVIPALAVGVAGNHSPHPLPCSQGGIPPTRNTLKPPPRLLNGSSRAGATLTAIPTSLLRSGAPAVRQQSLALCPGFPGRRGGLLKGVGAK